MDRRKDQWLRAEEFSQSNKKKKWVEWRQIEGLMGKYQVNHNHIYRSQMERNGQKTFEAIMTENFPNLGKVQTARSKESRESQIIQRDSYQDTWLTCQKRKTRKESLKQERETTYFAQGKPHKTNSKIFIRNFAGQKGMARFIQVWETNTHFQPGICCPANLFRFGKIRSFVNEQKGSECITAKVA